MGLHLRFIARQIVRSRKQAAVFVSCVVLSIVSLIALNGFSHSVDRAMRADARKLHAADIILSAHTPFSAPLESALSVLEENEEFQSARIHEFYSVVRSTREEGSLLAHLKVVDPGYPFYGKVVLSSGQRLAKVLQPGSVVVEQGLLDRLGLAVGDALGIGKAVMVIDDVLISEPDRPISFFSFGPRVFISSDNLGDIDLVKAGSRVRYKILVKAPPGADLDQTASVLRSAAVEDQEQVHTYRTARSRAKRFIDNFLFFLSLIGIFTLFLAGIGIQSALAAFLKDKEKTIAIMKTVGATSRFVSGHFLLILSCLGLLGTLTGIAIALLLQRFLPVLFSGMLPEDMPLSLSWTALGQGIGLGVLVVALFSFLPLHRLKEIRPSAIFRKEADRFPKTRVYILVTAAVGLFFTAMVLSQVEDMRVGVTFLAGAAVLLLAITLATRAALNLLRRLRIRRLVLRQALRGLFRPRNATGAIVVTLAASLTILFSIYLIERNLDATFVRSFPDQAPNVFFLDIQPSQKAAFSKLIGVPAVYYPVVRSRIVSINGQKIDRTKERRRRGDNLARPFNLTYRDHLLEDETIVSGSALFQKNRPGVQVSVLDTVVDIHPLKLGDRITFRIQGVPLPATVSSIRSRTREGMKPYFYFVFSDSVLKNAPQAIFTALRLPRDQIAPLQNRVVAEFPNISVIDVTQAVAVLSALMAKLSNIVRFFTAFSILAGLLIIVSSVFATRIARTREAVYYKILGARARFVLTVFLLENLLIGLISSVLALFFAQAAAWAITTQILDIDYRPFVPEGIGLLVSASILVTVVGLIPSVTILRYKPALFLRNQVQE